jgi:lipid-binding SYLF domain-containing protein
MSASIFSIIAILFTACVAPASVHASMQDDVDQAVTIIERFQQIPEKAIPTAVLREAKGLAMSLLEPKRVGAVLRRSVREGLVLAFKLELRSLSL